MSATSSSYFLHFPKAALHSFTAFTIAVLFLLMSQDLIKSRFSSTIPARSCQQEQASSALAFSQLFVHFLRSVIAALQSAIWVAFGVGRLERWQASWILSSHSSSVLDRLTICFTPELSGEEEPAHTGAEIFPPAASIRRRNAGIKTPFLLPFLLPIPDFVEILFSWSSKLATFPFNSFNALMALALQENGRHDVDVVFFAVFAPFRRFLSLRPFFPFLFLWVRFFPFFCFFFLWVRFFPFFCFFFLWVRFFPLPFF